VCEICIGELCSSADSTLDADITQLVRKKEYRAGCLVVCSQTMFDLVVSAETTFRTLQHTLLHSRDNVKQHLIQKIVENTNDVTFLSCHNVKETAAKRYVNARLQFYAKKQTRQRNVQMSKSGHELSSKSMQMHKSVSKIK